MTKVIKDVLTPADLSEIQTYLKQADFIDGRVTAGTRAIQVKRNLQLDAIEHRSFIEALSRKVAEHPFVKMWVKPVRATPVFVNCYEAGMEYGVHVDNPIMGDVRTDLSFTLFLSEPDSYEGGELQFIEQQSAGIKLPAGSLLLYETGGLHRVTPVTAGQRLVAVGWIQSLIRCAKLRETLFDLERVKNTLDAQPEARELSNVLSKCIFNLIRDAV